MVAKKCKTNEQKTNFRKQNYKYKNEFTTRETLAPLAPANNFTNYKF